MKFIVKLKPVLVIIFLLLCESFSLFFCFKNQASILFISIFTIFYVVCCFISVEIDQNKEVIIFLLITILAAFCNLLIGSIMVSMSPIELLPKAVLVNVIIYAAITFFIMAITNNIKAAQCISFFFIILIQFVNCMVYLYRGSDLQPTDFLALNTAMNVVSGYKLKIDLPILYGICMTMMIIVGMIVCIQLSHPRHHSLLKRRLYFAILSIALFACSIPGLSKIDSNTWKHLGTGTNGFLANFFSGFKYLYPEAPDNYSTDYIDNIADMYSEENSDDETPDIIVVMNESFSDLSILGDKFQVDQDPLKNYKSLETNTIKGYALASIFGGGTSNSEYEFLTGNSLGFFPNGIIAYQQYIKSDTYSMVSYLKGKGYDCTSLHPYLADGWSRTFVYPLLGFDQSLFLDDFDQTDLTRQYVSDRELYYKIISEYEEKTKEKRDPVFLFSVSMQNHGGYDDDGYESTVSLQNLTGEYSDAEQYLSLLKESDEALEILLNYFSQVDKKTIIVFYGDHQPRLNDQFFSEIHNGSFNSLDERELMYKVPFFIWTNYDIEEKNIELTSLNFLSNYVYKTAGIEIPKYNRFLEDIQTVIPAMNSQGYYSISKHSFMPYDDATGKEYEALNKYHILQYNSVFGRKNTNRDLFPIDSLQ